MGTKKEEITTITVEKSVHGIFIQNAKAMKMDLKSYMALLAQYLERTGQDITKDINTAQEVAKLKDQQVKFLRNFEKEKLGPIANNINMAVVELRSFSQTMKSIKAEQEKEHADLDTLLRFNIEQVKSVIDFISNKTEESELKRLINFTESYRHSALGFYKRLRGNILQRVTNMPEALKTCQQCFETFDKVFDELFEQGDYYQKQKP